MNALQKEMFLPGENNQSRFKVPTFFVGRGKPTPTVVFDTYWKFAAIRQDAFFNKIERPMSPPWSDDKILQTYKFTNAYRSADRVSQYLIRNVIYKGDQSIEEVFFRTILFKLFNKIETWEALEARFGELSWNSFDLKKYDKILLQLMNSGNTIYSAAYIMASAKSAFGQDRKHSNHLELLKKMMDEKVPHRIQQSPSLENVFEILLGYPSIGRFLAYQYAIDLNYGPILDFSENDFVVPGPGALSGISKCFSDTASWSPEDVIKYMTDNQDQEFERLGLEFKSLWGRPLHLIDCQNLFCEVDKYSRVKHPEISGVSGRTRIKQVYRPITSVIDYWFPEKWGINEMINMG